MRELYIFECAEEGILRLVPLYAATRAEAEEKMRQWVKEAQIQCLDTSTLRHYPQGFTFVFETLPGRLER